MWFKCATYTEKQKMSLDRRVDSDEDVPLIIRKWEEWEKSLGRRKHSLRGSGKLRQCSARKTKEERVSGMAWQVVSNATVVKDETLPEKY